ncbi:hypothetical protein [Streptomyces sp. NPDC091209]
MEPHSDVVHTMYDRDPSAPARPYSNARVRTRHMTLPLEQYEARSGSRWR